MTSDKQRTANRANGQKGGRQKGDGQDNTHAVIHTLYSRHRLYPHEDKEAYRNYVLSFITCLNPENTAEADMVLEIAHNRWCKTRSEQAEIESSLAAPSIESKNTQSLNATLLRARISRDINHTMTLLEKCRKLRRSQEKPPDPDPGGKHPHPPLITYVLLLDWEAETPPPFFPEGTPFSNADARQEQQALQHVRNAYEKQVQAMIPLETQDERYPVRTDLRIDAILKPEDTSPAETFIEPETPEAREAREMLAEFHDMLKAVHNPGEIPLASMFGRRQEPFLKFQIEPPLPFMRRRGDFLPKLAECYRLQALAPEAYPGKLGSFRIFRRPEDTLREIQHEWHPDDPLDPDPSNENSG